MTKNDFLIRFQNYSTVELLEVIEQDHFVDEAVQAATELFQSKGLSSDAIEEAKLDLTQLLLSRNENSNKTAKLIEKVSASSKKVVLKDILHGNTYMPSVFIGLAGLCYWLYFGYTDGKYIFSDFSDHPTFASFITLSMLFTLPTAALLILYRKNSGWVLGVFIVTMKISFLLVLLASIRDSNYAINYLFDIQVIQPLVLTSSIFILLVHHDFRTNFAISPLESAIGIGSGLVIGGLCS